MPDDEALDRVMNPARNHYRLDVINVSHHSPLMRALHHATYVFEKKLSHTADSQDQRHRMVPASRPMMTFTDTRRPDYITPRLIASNLRARAMYDEAMQDAWAAKNRLLEDIAVKHALEVSYVNGEVVRITGRPRVRDGRARAGSRSRAALFLHPGSARTRLLPGGAPVYNAPVVELTVSRRPPTPLSRRSSCRSARSWPSSSCSRPRWPAVQRDPSTT